MSLIEALNLNDNKSVISICGGGGKTTTLFYLAGLLQNKKVLVTTTTRILFPEPSDLYDIIIKKDSTDFLRHLNENTCKNVIVFGSSTSSDSRKLAGCTKSFIEEVKHYFDYILIEADGSAGRPVKAPAAHEPVISESTDVYIGVIGLDCLGKKADKQFVHRPELFSLIRNKNENEIITVEDLIFLIQSPVGLFKDAPRDCAKIVLLNKSDLLSRTSGNKLLSEMYKAINIPLKIILNSYKSEKTITSFDE